VRFPEDIETLQTCIATRGGAIADVLQGLLRSWQERNPGKHGGAFFLIGIDLRSRVVAHQFVPKGTKVNMTSKEWKELEKAKTSHDAPYQGVPPWYSVVSLSAVAKSECKWCKTELPIIESLEQTEGSWDGDTWVRERFVLCLDCDLKTLLQSRTADNPFVEIES
jgi:hypothetical protein